MRKLLIASLLATAMVAAPGLAQARVYVDVDIAPPPDRVEVVPAPRRGYVWAPGYWEYNGRRHVWTRGHWVRARHGYHWNHDHWVERNGRWHYERGRWDRD